MKKEEKAKELLSKNKIKIDMRSDKRIFFIVESNKEHSVIFDKDRGWSCTCKYSSLNQGECSHILACQLFLKQKNETKEES